MVDGEFLGIYTLSIHTIKKKANNKFETCCFLICILCEYPTRVPTTITI